jgi:hypothetical protein
MNGGMSFGKMFRFMELLVDDKFPKLIFLKEENKDKEISLLLLVTDLFNQFHKL